MTDHQTTHADDCWSWGHAHYECAVREIERLQAEMERLREALRLIESASSRGFGIDYARGLAQSVLREQLGEGERQ